MNPTTSRDSIDTARPALSNVAPDLTPPCVAPRPVKRASSRGGFDWRIFAAVLGASSISLAATAGAVWVKRHETPRVLLPPVENPVAVDRTAASTDLPPLVSAPVEASAHARSSSAVTHSARAHRQNASHPVRTAVDTHGAHGAPNAPPPSCTAQCAGNVACLLQCPYDGHAAGGGMVNPVPSSAQLDSAFGHVHGAVILCGLGLANAPRTTRVAVTFGSDGRVTSATVLGSYAGTGPGACIERTMREVHVPAFANASFETTRTFVVE